MGEKGDAVVYVIGTADTKMEELAFLTNSLRSHLSIFSPTSSDKVAHLRISLSTVLYYYRDNSVCNYLIVYMHLTYSLLFNFAR